MPKVGNGHVLQDGQRGLIFAYTPDEQHAILTALEQAGMQEDVDREAILQRITEAARQALVRLD